MTSPFINRWLTYRIEEYAVKVAREVVQVCISEAGRPLYKRNVLLCVDALQGSLRGMSCLQATEVREVFMRASIEPLNKVDPTHGN